MIGSLDVIKEASVAIERQSLDLLSELVIAAREGRQAIDAVLEAAMEAAGCSIEPLNYAPDTVPLVDEFAAGTVAATTNERCLIGHLRGRGDGKSLLLFAHPDTEDACDAKDWRTDPFQPTIRDGRLYGWGVADDFAGLAMLVQSVRLLQAAGLGLEGGVVLVSAPSKRHRRGIAAALHHGVSADAAVYLHPAESGRGLDEIKAYAPGQLEFTITVGGRLPDTSEPAHTAFAHRAVNAFDKAMTIAAALKAFDDRRGRDVRHPTIQDVIGRSVNLMLSVCRFGAPDKLSRLTPSCQLGGAMTLIPGERLDDVMATVEATVAKVAQKDGWLRENPPVIEWLAGVSAAETEKESDLYQFVSGALERLGASPKVNPLHTSSDIRNPMVQMAMPTVGFGPLCGGLAMSGEADEWVDVADYHRAIMAAALVIADWCGVMERDTS